ncbi:MAG: bifunctional adenosylcobinamide kinase/adenosylcobinamide-phosphate guanylyltransferase [Lachnospirales bacterium]
MKIFISGGCKNGKSYYAQRLAKEQVGELYYVATMIPTDREDEARIERHIEDRRGWGFTTIEESKNIANITKYQGSFLVDSITALLANVMFQQEINLNASEIIIKDLEKVLAQSENIVFVSDYIYSDSYIYDEYTEAYRKSLGKIDRYLAEQCHVVIEVAYTSIIIHKGEYEFKKIF